MTTLYEWPPTRSQRAKWALEELGIPYDSSPVDLNAGQQNMPEHRARQPLGAVPALDGDGYTMFESVAIVMQLIDEHPEAGLAPAPGTAARAAYYQWCVFAAAELDPAVMMVFDNTMRPLESMRPTGTPHNPAMAEKGRMDVAERAAVLSNALEGRDYLVADSFTGADIVVGHSCFMLGFIGMLDDFPVLSAYHTRLTERPAHKRAHPG